MKCTDAEKYILLQDSGELPDYRKRALAAHIHDCDPCREFQFTLLESHAIYEEELQEEPSITAVRNVLREARTNTPEKARARIFAWKPALAMAASFVIALGLFFSTVTPDKVGLELVVTETQLLEAQDQLVSVLYSGVSEDDRAFNFLMTYEEG